MLSFLLSIADKSDHEKVEYVYHQYHQSMLRLARSRLRGMGAVNSDLDAEDVVQNAFVKIVLNINKIDFSLSEREIRNYIMKIVINEALIFMADVVYTDNIDKYTETLSDGVFFEQMDIRENYREVVAALKMLDERYSIALSLRYMENLSIKEIAAMLGIEEKSVYTRIERGREKLMDLLDRRSQ